ncbi:UpxZ family transcription anti-terminator antagonist [Bacteroides sp.]|uniref:UpxZ family transcription anti-terminator antagonist n=1 Tax=Bacteroides sp. TaxID=29523 RepID=UPI0025BE663B|nr:UpxZ family transcription anti-terminator antagonist [Bacteroides sp.]
MNQVRELQSISHELLYLGVDGTPIYTDRFCQLNTEVFRLSESLFDRKGETDEEEASLCLALLMGYRATAYSDSNKEAKIQEILDRAFIVLDHLGNSVLKCRLLVSCYSEVLDEELIEEIRRIVDGWGSGRQLSSEEETVVEALKELEEGKL